MPSTTTKKMRTKRPDTRPNANERRKIGKKMEAQKAIQDLRVTRKRKSEHVERVVERAPEVKQSLPENEKILRALRKKMRKINNLIEIQNAGTELDDQQLALVGSLDEIVEKMEDFMNAELEDKDDEGDSD
mmetsp:Transcript_24779/g.41922  ORF Transcript_24779/g.41922 Transcript_24779/m.41922 type:complete len:131 (+) Transcript_24779:75-467(+)|eukprot:CAMPEP_0114419504 /NCGR_PEP_ID=MMETSP0103-20121206/4059_1 /TAXON_ID=37642 ORGANISM="Paraphysomonas imperforata, Strain PA2" /NCGR_SAMPLE_ID=MMETSP0103 /ASSEMBLY_ACC=CAM_ASM_000201 /LENGTH=130 /DNA_ID=CAMNT_0001587921 /DNA_START=84 /DNA_END=476 /DNA_ORIENTATION=+